MLEIGKTYKDISNNSYKVLGKTLRDQFVAEYRLSVTNEIRYYIFDSEGKMLGGANWTVTGDSSRFDLVVKTRRDFEYKRVYKDGSTCSNWLSTQGVTPTVFKSLHASTITYIVRVDGVVSTKTPEEFNALVDERLIINA